VVEAPSGDATTTLYLDASKNSLHPLGVLTSIVDTFINGGTTTEYMTQHVGTHINSIYAKIQTTSSREYYRINPTATVKDYYDSPVRPTGLIGSSTSLEVNGPASTFYTVEEYRTYVDGHYAHLVSSISNVVTDPAYITPTPIFNPQGAPSLNSDHKSAEDEIKKSLYSSYDYNIKPTKHNYNYGLATRTVGKRIFSVGSAEALELELENEIEADLYRQSKYEDEYSGNSLKLPRQIDLDAVESESFEFKVRPDKPEPISRPTYTVGENGELNFPTPSIEVVRPEANIEATQAHRFAPPPKPTKTKLDSVTYVGFVDFTTTIDDTVVIFRPKQTFSTETRGLIRPVIQPTRTFSQVATSSVGSRQDHPRQHPFQQRPALAQPSRGFQPEQPQPTQNIIPEITSSSLSEEERTSIQHENAIEVDEDDENDIKKHTSGIDALKSLLSQTRRTKYALGQSTASPNQIASSSARPDDNSSRNLNTRFNPFSSSVRPSLSRPNSGIVSSTITGEDTTTDPSVEIIPSIDPTSDVEIVFKTLYTTYTYFTTFFRETTTRVKSREEVISVVLTVTNLLKSTDIPSISSSCQLDSSCLFKSTDILDVSDFDGTIGRPNTRQEQPRSGGKGRPVAGDELISPTNLGDDVNAVLRTFYTTYTYFSTLFVDGTSTVSTRTEVYSNIKSNSVAISQIDSDSISILPTSSFVVTAPTVSITPELEPSSVGSVFPVRRLEISSIKPVQLHSELTTPGSEDDSERPSTDRVPRVKFLATTEKSTTQQDSEEPSTEWIQPTPIFSTTTEEAEDDGVFVVTQETPALSEEVTEVVTSATTESEEEIDAAVTEFVPRTLYTTFTYFTTLFQGGNSVVTSNLETVTNVMTDPFVEPTAVEPSVTFFTTFTYWTTLFDTIDGQNITSVTSREETLTDILPATVTSQFSNKNAVEQTQAPEYPTIEPSVEVDEAIIESTIAPALNSEAKVFTFYTTHYEGDSPVVETILSTSGPVSTSVPEIQSSESDIEVISASTIETPEVSSTIAPTTSFQDIDEDLTLSSENDDESDAKEGNAEDGVKPTRTRSRISFSRPGNTFTPVIRPVLRDRKPGRIFRPSNFRVTTTVATRTRNSVKPTLIATPASSAPQPTPSFGSSSRPGFLASSSLFNRGQGRSSSVPGSSLLGSASISPSAVASRGSASFASSVATTEPPSVVISPIRLRRPNPFRARLKERQQERLANLRTSNKSKFNRIRTADPTKSTEPEEGTSVISIPNLPSIPGSNAPIFVSSQRQTIAPNRRVPKGDIGLDSISVPADTAAKRERARERIKSLFSRKRPLFGRTSPSVLSGKAQTRRKRQVSTYGAEFGSRTRARQSYVSGRAYNSQPQYLSSYPDQDQQPFTAFSQTQQQLVDYYYEDDDDSFPSSNSVRSPSSSSRHQTAFRRQAPSDVPEQTTRTLRPRSRSRAASRFKGKTATSAPKTRTRTRFRNTVRSNPKTTTTTASPRLATRFRPRTLSNPRSIGNNNRNSNQNNRGSSIKSHRDSLFSTSSRDTTRNRFGSTSSTRNNLFTRGKVVDYDDYDYYDYEDTNLQSSQNGVPDFITVTHQVPIATKIPVIEFGRTELRDILSTSPSLEVVAVTALKSTDISDSPIIYANAHTLTPQAGIQDILFDALRATETTSVTFTPTRIRGRKTSFSHIIPTTIYNVETITTRIIQPVDQNQLLNSLLQQLLLGGGTNPLNALNPLQQNPLQPNPILQNLAPVPSTPVTNIVTHTSTYVTTITEEDSTVIPITFRGKAITTTLIEKSTKVITATEFSTETVVHSVPVRQPAAFLQNIAPTQAPLANPQIASLLPALLGVQQANLFNQQNEQQALLQHQQALLLQQQQQQQQNSFQLTEAQQEELNEQLLAKINLDDFSDEDLANLDIDAVVEAVTRQQSQSKSPLHFPKKNIFGTLPLNPTPAEEPQPEAPKSSIITIFKSGASPGDFTRVFSTVYFDEKRRKRDANDIDPSKPIFVKKTETLGLDSGLFILGGARGPVDAPIFDLTDSFIQSGLVSEKETHSLSQVIPTLSLEDASQQP